MKFNNFYFVNIKKYDNVIGVITENYYNKFIYNSCELPDYYNLFEYNPWHLPFSFTTLNQHLPFTKESTGLKLSSNVIGIEYAALKFHLDIINVFKFNNLDANIFWYRHLNNIEELSKIHATFEQEYRQFLQINI